MTYNVLSGTLSLYTTTGLGELTTLPRRPSRLRRRHPCPDQPYSAPRPSHLRRSGLSPTHNLWLHHWSSFTSIPTHPRRTSIPSPPVPAKVCFHAHSITTCTTTECGLSSNENISLIQAVLSIN